jgi:hypothetical protein
MGKLQIVCTRTWAVPPSPHYQFRVENAIYICYARLGWFAVVRRVSTQPSPYYK